MFLGGRIGYGWIGLQLRAHPFRLPGLLAAMPLICASAAFASPPGRTWRTIEVPGAQIHFHDGLDGPADRAARIAAWAIPQLLAILETSSDQTIHLTLSDETDDANGYARVVPYSRIGLLAATPTPLSDLGYYADSLEILVVHELTHVLHLGTIHGLPRALNTVLGRTVSPQEGAPPWLTEGLAVYLESKLTGTGRNRSPYVDMVLRARSLGDGYPSLEELSGSIRDFPGSVMAWTLGGRFVEFIVAERGSAALARFVHTFGTRPVPFGSNLVARETLGRDFVELYSRFVETERDQARVIEARALSAGLSLGRKAAFRAESARRPVWSVDGRLGAFEEPRDGDRTFTLLDPLGERKMRTTAEVASPISGGRFLFDEVEPRISYSFRALRIADLETEATLPVEVEGRRPRLSDPDARDDGRRIVAIERRGGSTRVVELQGEVSGPYRARVVYEPPPEIDVSTPRYLPDGSIVAAETTGRGGRRLIHLSPNGERSVLTNPPGRDDACPAPSPDGRSVYFARDLDGVYDIFRVEIASSRVDRVTRSITGAIEPAIDPSGTKLAFASAASTGFEVRVIEVGTPTSSVAKAVAPAPRKKSHSQASGAIGVPYRPWSTLYPRAWLPTHGYDGDGDTYGILVSAEDARTLLSYRLRLDFGIESQKIGFSFAAEDRDSTFPFRLDAGLFHGRTYATYVAASRSADRTESVLTVRGGFTIPIPLRLIDQSLSFSYGVELRRGDPLPILDPMQNAPTTLGDLAIAPVVLSYGLSTARGTQESNGAVRGISFDLGVRIHHPRLGSDFEALVISSHLTGYVPLPLRGAAWVARAGFGAGFGDPRGRFFYALGGLPVRDILSDSIDGVRYGSDNIRGFPENELRGSAFALLNLEARAPISDLSFGFGTLPFFVDRLHGAIFLDAGTAGQLGELDRAEVGVGAEARLDMLAGYGFRMTARLGYARGLGPQGIDNFFLILGPTL